MRYTFDVGVEISGAFLLLKCESLFIHARPYRLAGIGSKSLSLFQKRILDLMDGKYGKEESHCSINGLAQYRKAGRDARELSRLNESTRSRAY